jgi:glycosyltransferase involved in cell wall biosynthesis
MKVATGRGARSCKLHRPDGSAGWRYVTFRGIVRAVVPAMRRPAAAIRLISSIIRVGDRRVFFRLSERISPRARSRLFRPLLRASDVRLRLRPTSSYAIRLKALSLWELGRRDEAMSFVERAGEVAGERTRLWLAGFCIGVERPVPASLRLDRIGGHRSLALQAEASWRGGRLREAQAQIREAQRLDRGDRPLRRLRERIDGELRALTPGWRPGAPSFPRRIEPTRGRVLHLLTNSLPYRQAGYTVRSHQVARWQREVGLDPHVATQAGFPASGGVIGIPQRETIQGVPYYRLLPDLPFGLPLDRHLELNVNAASELTEELAPSVLHAASNHLNAQTALALRDRYSLPVVYEVRGFLEETWLSKMGTGAAMSDRYQLSRTNETDCMRLADAVVTLSETMKREIVERGVDPERITVVPNAVEVEAFRPRARDGALARALGIGDGEDVIGYVSTLNAYEGIGYLIEAAAHLRSWGRRVRLLLVGDGLERAALEETARRVGIKDAVVFTGHVPYEDVARYYSLMEIFVVPRTDARVCQLVTPLKPYEAMAMARPLVVSRVAALLEIANGGETAHTFTPCDSHDLADVLDRLLADAPERARLGDAARRWVVQHRTWRQNGERYRALYERLGAA